MDLAELRPYQPGDDVRAIDWNVTARSAQPFVRRFHEERDLTVWLILDLTASLDFGSAEQTKRERLLDVAGTLARLLTGRGDRVGALLYSGGDRAEMVAASGGRMHVLQLLKRALDAVERASQPAKRRPPDAPVTDLAALLEQAFQSAHRRSLVVVLSDFLAGDDPMWERALGVLAQRHEVVGVWLRDEREIALPDVGVVTFEDAETGEQVVVDTSQPTLRATYASLAQAQDEALAMVFARHRAALWPLSTAEPLVPALVRFLEQRRRVATGARRLSATA